MRFYIQRCLAIAALLPLAFNIGATDPASAFWEQQARLLASDGGGNHNFGVAVEIDGDTAIVGAQGANISRGRAYIFVRDGGVWNEQAIFATPDNQSGAQFGNAVAVDGDTAAVGAHMYNVDGNNNQGAVFLFTRTGGEWVPAGVLTADAGAGGDNFGFSVALDGDILVVGGHGANPGGNSNQGAAWIFEHDGEDWNEHTMLVVPDGTSGDRFGRAVAVEAETVIVSASLFNVDGNNNQGQVFVFERDGDGWSETTRLTASDGGSQEQFGYDIAFNGDTLLVGAHFHNQSGNLNQGAAYLFSRAGGTWEETQKIFASDGQAGDRFGLSVGVHGDIAVVGTIADVDGNSNQGAAYVFLRDGDDWLEVDRLLASDGQGGDQFGHASAVSHGTILVGANFANAEGNTNRGAAYVFVEGTPTPGLTPAPDSLDFGAVIIGHTAPALAVELHNTGTGALEISHAEMAGAHAADFAVVSDDCTGEMVGVGEACLIELSFTPSALGERMAELVIDSNAPDSPDSVALHGSGLPEPPQLEVTPDAFSVAVPMDASLEQALTIANLGLGELHWNIVDDERAGGLRQPVRPATVFQTAPAAATGVLGRVTTDAPPTASRTAAQPHDMITLTHSTSQDVMAQHTIACVPQGTPYTSKNQFLRTFTLDDFDIAGEFQISAVAFGVEIAEPTVTVTVNLYTLEGDFTYDNLTLLASEEANIGTGQGFVEQVPIEATVPAGATLVMEVDVPNLNDIGRFVVGSNNAGETAPSYLASPNCGFDHPVTYASIDFPDVHLVMSVTGTESEVLECDLPAWLNVDPLSGSVAPESEHEIAVTFDATGLAVGDYTTTLCVASNDPERPVETVEVEMVVTDPPDPVPGELAVEPLALAFGAVTVGDAVTLEITVGNAAEPGAEALELVTIDVLPELAVFTLGGDCSPGQVLAPDQSCAVTVTFAPDGEETFSAAVMITTAGGQNATVELSGSGFEAGDPIFSDRFETDGDT